MLMWFTVMERFRLSAMWALNIQGKNLRAIAVIVVSISLSLSVARI